MSRPRIVILKFAPTARDPRILRQIKLLSALGDIVTVGYGPAPAGVVEHIEIPEHLRAWRTNRFLALLLYVLHLHRRLFFGAERVKFVQKALPAGSMDVVLAHDALGAPLALSLEPRLGTHIDLNEYAPRQGDPLSWRLLVAPFMRWASRQVRAADSATTVAPGIAEEYRNRFGFECGVVENAAPFRADLTPTEPGDPLRLVHIGIAGRARKLEVMMDGVELAHKRRPGAVTFDLLLAAGEESYIEELRRRSQASGSGVVRVLPPVPYDQMVSTLAQYDVGMFVCPPTTFNLLHALPNKFFEFVQARLGVVIGPSPEMSHVVDEFGFGVVAPGFDAAATAQAIGELDANRVRELKAASHTSARALSSEELSKPWVEAIEAILRTEPDPSSGASQMNPGAR